MTQADEDGVVELIEMAEVHLRLAGEPTTPSEHLLHAQTAAMIALLKMNTRPKSSKTNSNNVSKLPAAIARVAVKYGMDREDMCDTMKLAVARVSNWEVQAIQTIKELRSIGGFQLVDAKDLYDTSRNYPTWWQ